MALGGYGWVEDLAPAAPRREILPTEPDFPRLPDAAGTPDPEVPRPLYRSAGNWGFVHAPSLAHATTAAILRGGFLSRLAAGDGDALAVNLSSERVRLAL